MKFDAFRAGDVVKSGAAQRQWSEGTSTLNWKWPWIKLHYKKWGREKKDKEAEPEGLVVEKI